MIFKTYNLISNLFLNNNRINCHTFFKHSKLKFWSYRMDYMLLDSDGNQKYKNKRNLFKLK